ncbi:MAG: Peptidoglycan D,D-transpeptidase MrdA [Phycisphaerae bacterium]|nr:Peptidoglycan D,D-transpeptidase MrdA [Phycisphaerae bacterium]
MFESRLKWFSFLLGLLALAIVLRLVDIQLLHAADYELLAGRILTRAPVLLPAVRGSILDRDGQVLVCDEPAYDVCVHYGVLSGNDDYLPAVARELRRRGERPAGTPLREIVAELRMQITEVMWPRLAAITGVSVADLIERGERIRARVETIRQAAGQPVREERMFHPIVESVDESALLAIRMELERMPWLTITPGSRRVVHDADHLAHLLGRTGAVSAEALERDPDRDDERRALRPGERCGVSGIELAGEEQLRGVRGRLVEDLDRRVIEHADQQRGSDVRLTISAELQRRATEMLGDAVANSIYPAGGAAVVIDVATREVLVLASWPDYASERFSSDYAALQEDLVGRPLLFRAVQAQYAAGSTCKAVTLVAALTEGVTTPSRTVECRGFLHTPDAFRCWIFNQYGSSHGPMDAELAVKNSCNIYFYVMGEELGPSKLCEWFTQFGLGRPAGTGLIEESPGIVPSEAWLLRHRERTFQNADARNFAVGQGEITITPLQAANVGATIASGVWRPVKLYDTDESASDPPREAGPPLPAVGLRVLRRGMWRVVNDEGGTAEMAKLATPGVVMCGKTGSAQASPIAIRWRFRCTWPGGREEWVVAASRDVLLAALADDPPTIVDAEIVERYPPWQPGDRLPSHAWLVGYTQDADTPPGDVPRGRSYAIAVVIEFGGGGGRVAGPLARRIMEAVLAHEGAAATSRDLGGAAPQTP